MTVTLLGTEVGGERDHLEGVSRITRGGEVRWEKPFLTGEANMAHSLANLEYHHFKYATFCQPNQLHVHFFGAAVLSFGDDIALEDGDEMRIECDITTRPLSNVLKRVSASKPVIESL